MADSLFEGFFDSQVDLYDDMAEFKDK